MAIGLEIGVATCIKYLTKTSFLIVIEINNDKRIIFDNFIKKKGAHALKADFLGFVVLMLLLLGTLPVHAQYTPQDCQTEIKK